MLAGASPQNSQRGLKPQRRSGERGGLDSPWRGCPQAGCRRWLRCGGSSVWAVPSAGSSAGVSWSSRQALAPPAPTDATAKLMELRQAKAIGAFDHHQRSVRNVDTDPMTVVAHSTCSSPARKRSMIRRARSTRGARAPGQCAAQAGQLAARRGGRSRSESRSSRSPRSADRPSRPAAPSRPPAAPPRAPATARQPPTAPA